jgi:hypothetical protein
VTSLPAEEPLGGRCVDCDREGRGSGGIGGNGLEARISTVGHGLAGSGECRLRHGVVLGVEDKRNGVAHGRVDARWIERKGTVTDCDGVGLSRSEANEGGEGSGSESKTHVDSCLSVFQGREGKAGFETIKKNWMLI